MVTFTACFPGEAYSMHLAIKATLSVSDCHIQSDIGLKLHNHLTKYQYLPVSYLGIGKSRPRRSQISYWRGSGTQLVQGTESYGVPELLLLRFLAYCCPSLIHIVFSLTTILAPSTTRHYVALSLVILGFQRTAAPSFPTAATTSSGIQWLLGNV